MPLPSENHPCMGYICGVPDGLIAGWTIDDCTNAGYYGNLSGCTDPQCATWRIAIPRCVGQVLRQAEREDPYVVQPLPYDPGIPEDPLNPSGSSRSCCCGSNAGGGGSSSGGGSTAGGGGSSSGGGSTAGGGGEFYIFGFPWWVIVLIVILIIKLRDK